MPKFTKDLLNKGNKLIGGLLTGTVDAENIVCRICQTKEETSQHILRQWGEEVGRLRLECVGEPYIFVQISKTGIQPDKNIYAML